jgi:hypothetical protein
MCICHWRVKEAWRAVTLLISRPLDYQFDSSDYVTWDDAETNKLLLSDVKKRPRPILTHLIAVGNLYPTIYEH